MHGCIDKTSSPFSKRPWARGLLDTIYCGRIDVCPSDFHVPEFRRNSQPVSFATISVKYATFFHTRCCGFLCKNFTFFCRNLTVFIYTHSCTSLHFNTVNVKRKWSYSGAILFILRHIFGASKAMSLKKIYF